MGNSVETAVHPGSLSHQVSRRLSFTGARKAEDKSILLVGLDGSGKTSVPNTSATSTLPSSWAAPFPAPSKTPTVKTAPIHARFFKLLDMPGHRDCRDTWYTHVSESGVICFCIDISDVIRYPMVAKELERLYQVLATNPSPPLVWILFTKIDCNLQGQRCNAIDAYETIKKCHVRQTRKACAWSFILMPMINCLNEAQLNSMKVWIHENLPYKI
ncbi:hypothetical protein ACHHYP_08867 [Achlya hypogyna]|uniref:Signal recognition particle receptor subunit beta n=1 Tax=Achlya hypogyna TaxID=1202772 RepID=A0A1V9YNX7_ACHHY|nr:hypothetical protein ACHHYP_08867 [Achlya hypogyna]